MIRFACPKCEMVLTATERRAGAVISCPGCGQRMEVPGGPARKRPYEDEDDEPRSGGPRRGGGRDRQAAGVGLWLVLAGAIVVLAIAIVAVAIAFLPDKKDDTQQTADNGSKESSPSAGNNAGGDTNPNSQAGPGDAAPTKPNPDKGDGPGTALPSGGGPLSGDKIYDRLLKSCVWVLAKEGRGYASGSGSLIDRKNRIILTNYHVVTNKAEVAVLWPTYKDGKLVTAKKEYIDQAAGEQVARGTVLARDMKRDLALIQLPQLPPGVLGLRPAAASARPGSTVHSVGNPGSSDGLWLYTAGAVKQVFHKAWQAEGAGIGVLNLEAWVVETQSPTNPGDSGGPLVNDRAELVGVTQGGAVKAQLLSTFIDVREVKDFVDSSLRSANLKWEIETEGPHAGPDPTEVAADMPTLVKGLSSADAAVRANSATGLGLLGGKAQNAIPSLVNALRDDDPFVRRVTLEALQKIGKPSRADLPVLVAGLKDAVGDVRMYAAEALGQLGPDAASAVPALIEATRDLDNVTVRRNAFQALARVGTRDRDKVLPVLLTALKDTDRENRAAAQEALTTLGPPSAADVAMLRDAAKDPSPELRPYAIGLLGKLGPQAREAVPTLIEALAQHDSLTRCAAAEALGRIGPEAKAATPKLMAALQGEDPSLSSRAAEALGRIGSLTRTDVPRVSEWLKSDKPHVRASAIMLLGRLETDPKEMIPSLGEALKDPDKQVRAQAAQALGAFGPNVKEAVPRLMEAARDPDKEVRKQGVLALARFGPLASAATPLLIDIIKERDKDRELFGHAVVTLGAIGPDAKASLRDLVSALGAQDNKEYREKIFLAMSKMGRHAVVYLTPLLTSEDKEVRLGAATALGNIGPEVVTSRVSTTIPLLQQHALADASPEVKEACLVAIRKIAGRQ